MATKLTATQTTTDLYTSRVVDVDGAPDYVLTFCPHLDSDGDRELDFSISGPDNAVLGALQWATSFRMRLADAAPILGDQLMAVVRTARATMLDERCREAQYNEVWDLVRIAISDYSLWFENLSASDEREIEMRITNY